MYISEEATTVIEKIAEIQISSYNRILNKGVSPLDISTFLLSPEDIKRYAKRTRENYEELILEPSLIAIFDEKEIMTMRHILYRMEEDWVTKHPQGCQDTWEIFFNIEESRNPKISFSLKNLQPWTSQK